MGRPLTFEEFINMHVELAKPKKLPRMFITAGTGIPDAMAVQCFKEFDPELIVVTRDGQKWKGGEIIEELHNL